MLIKHTTGYVDVTTYVHFTFLPYRSTFTTKIFTFPNGYYVSHIDAVTENITGEKANFR